MTKPLYKPQFEYVRKHIMGWSIYSETMQYFHMRECECTENVRKNKYVCIIFALLITLYVNLRLNGFHNL